MSETELDAIRRHIKAGEERLKQAAAEDLNRKALPSDQPANTETMPPARDQAIPPVAGLKPIQTGAATEPGSRPAGAVEPPRIEGKSTSADLASQDLLAARQQAQLLQTKLKIVLENSRDAIISVDGDRKWIPANHRLREWLGYAEEEFSKIDFKSLFQPETAAVLLESLPRWLDEETPLRKVSGDLRGKGDVPIPVLISSHAGLNERAEPFAYLMFENIRPQRALELQMERGRAFVKTLLQEGSIPTLVLQKDGAIEEANRSACELLGIGSDEIRGASLRDFVHLANLAEYEDALDRALHGLPSAEARCAFLSNNKIQFRGQILFTGVADVHGKVECVMVMLNQVVAEPTSAWTAYGLMTPGVLSELSGFMADVLRVVLEQVKAKTKPDVKRLVKGINHARSVISHWMESAALIPEFSAPRAFGDVIRQAVDYCRAEFSRWRITPQFEITPAATEVCDWPPEIFQALLHVIQWCIVHLREDPGTRRLVIWVQKEKDHLEVSFLCRCAKAAGSMNLVDMGADPDDTLGVQSFELRAARKLLDTIGATLELEDLGKSHHAIRISVTPSIFSASCKLSTQSRTLL